MKLTESFPWKAVFPASRSVRARSERVLSGADLEVLREQARDFDLEIRTALRSTTTVMTVALIVLTLGVSLTKDVSRDIGLLVLFPLLAIVATFHAQVAADVAVMAEVRDRLASIVNHETKYPLLNVRLISDIRRFAAGTVGMNAVVGLAGAFTMYFALDYAWDRSKADSVPRVFAGGAYFWLMLAVIVLTIAAILLAMADIGVGRKAILNHLDDVFGCKTRPDHLRTLPHGSACRSPLTAKAETCPFKPAQQSP